MPYIPESLTCQVKERIKNNPLPIFSSRVILAQKGNNYKGCCPFHKEKTPSFIVTPSKWMFKCFGCGIGGDPITFLMLFHAVRFNEAIAIAAKEYGILI